MVDSRKSCRESHRGATHATFESSGTAARAGTTHHGQSRDRAGRDHRAAVLDARFLHYFDYCCHHRLHPRTIRGLADAHPFPAQWGSFVVCTVALMLLYLAGLGAYTQIVGLWEELPRFSQRITDIVEGVRHKIDDMEANTYRMMGQRQTTAAAGPTTSAGAAQA